MYLFLMTYFQNGFFAYTVNLEHNICVFVTPGRGNFCFNTELAQIFSTREKKKRAETAIDIQTILGTLCCLVCELK